MKFGFEQHCEQDSLELYALGKLGQANTDQLEEHILICEGCRSRLDETDRYVRAMRSGAARLRLEEAGKAARPVEPPFRWLFLPTPGWGAAAAAFCGLAVLASISLYRPNPFFSTGANDSSVSVDLRAERGTTAPSPAHRKLHLRLDLRGLQLGAGTREEIVDTQGRIVQTANAPQIAQSAEIQTSRGFDRGTYFVRVYAPHAAEVAREFALDIR